MKLRLDPESPVPLYHQIVVAMRYRIATGELKPEQLLPTVREASAAWGVNMHTVRRAYGELAQEGLVESRPAKGTRVLRAAPSSAHSGSALASFLSETVRRASDEFELSPGELATLVGGWSAPRKPGGHVVHVLECNQWQCERHATEIEGAWNVEAAAWPLGRTGDPPPGQWVATYFHYNEIRRRWPLLLPQIYFVGVRPTAELAEQLLARNSKGKRQGVLLCEFDEASAKNIAADLLASLPAGRFAVETRVVERAGEALESSRSRRPVLFAPRVWNALSEAERRDPRAHVVDYSILREDLQALGEYFAWPRASRRHRTVSN